MIFRSDMQINLLNTVQGLKPIYPNDFDEKRKLKLNQEYVAEVKLPRNPQFHRKFMALINVGHAHTNLDMPFNSYRKYMTIKAGFFETYNTAKGTYIEPKSISFSNMDDSEFQDVYNRVLDAILNDCGAKSEDIENEIRAFI